MFLCYFLLVIENNNKLLGYYKNIKIKKEYK